MQNISVLYLSQSDILNLKISMHKVIELIEKGLREHGKGMVENPPKPGIHGFPNSFIHAMPAYFKNLNIGGLKWVSGYPGNREIGLPQIIGVLILNDMKTGVPTCIMDATWITAVRTAAVSAVTAKYCAKENANILGVVGTGVQGRQNILALKIVRPSISKIKIFDINPEASKKLKNDFSEKIDSEISIQDNVEAVAVESDIIVTATQRLEKPIIKNEWFGKGCLGLGLEASRAWYGDALLSADKFITDDIEQTKHFKAQGAFADGFPKLFAELGKIVSGERPGRENSIERIIAINIGLALEDIILANHIYEIAVANKIGLKLELL